MNAFGQRQLSTGHHPNRQSPFLGLSKDLFTSQKPLQQKVACLPELVTKKERGLQLRQCCKVKEDIRYSISKQNKIRRYRTNSGVRCLPWQNGRQQQLKSRKRQQLRTKQVKTLKKGRRIASKQQYYVLPRLKQFNSEQLKDFQLDNQTRHKIVNNKNVKILRTQGSDNNINAVHLHNRNRNYSEMQSGLASREDTLGIYRQNHSTSRAKILEDKDDTEQTNITGPYYKYIENYPTIKKQMEPKNQKKSLPFEDQQRSVPSQLKQTARKDQNTLFHQNKIKYSQPIMTKSNLSLSSSKKLPQTEQQLSSFLIKYQPIDPNFDLKALVKENNFEIDKKESEVYIGLIKDGKRQGKGVLITEHFIFQGSFSKNLKIIGCEKNQNGVYKGTFRDGKRHGRGQFEWGNGQTFEGQWKNGKKDGHGIWRSPKGNFYQGQWKNNKQNGKGIYIHVGGSKYTGYFKDFLKHGRGEEQFNNGDCYSGQYKDGKPHGYGKYLWKNGDRYEGQFVCGSREGKGILTKADGIKFEGDFENDLKHGQGKQKYPNGEYFVGEFNGGDKVSGKLYTAKGQVIEEISG